MKLMTNKALETLNNTIQDQQDHIAELESRIAELESVNNQWEVHCNWQAQQLRKYETVVIDYRIKSGDLTAHKVSNGHATKVYAMELPNMPKTDAAMSMDDNGHIIADIETSELITTDPNNRNRPIFGGKSITVKSKTEPVIVADNKSTPIVKSNGKAKQSKAKSEPTTNPQGAKSKLVYDMVKSELGRDLSESEQNWLIMKVESWTQNDSSVSVQECCKRAVSSIKSGKISKA